MVEPLIIGFYGHSNTGKTSLITRLITHFSEKNFTIASIKQTTGSYSIDSPGKDTWKHGVAGAKISCLQTAVETSLIIRKHLPVQDIIKIISEIDSIDLLIIEGANDESILKIRVDEKTPLRKNTVFTFDGDVYKVCTFIEKEMKKQENI